VFSKHEAGVRFTYIALMKTINKESFEYQSGRLYVGTIDPTLKEINPDKVLRKIFRHLPTNKNWLAGFYDAWKEKMENK
jgi:hypothetical protein